MTVEIIHDARPILVNSVYYCHLLIIFANKLDPGQGRHMFIFCNRSGLLVLWARSRYKLHVFHTLMVNTMCSLASGLLCLHISHERKKY